MRPCICCGEQVELVADGLCKLCDTFITSSDDADYPSSDED